MQLWGVQTGGLLDTLPGGEGADAVTAVEPMQAAPYLLLGLRSGSIRVAALLGESGNAEGGAREACSMQMLPHESAHGSTPCMPLLATHACELSHGMLCRKHCHPASLPSRLGTRD